MLHHQHAGPELDRIASAPLAVRIAPVLVDLALCRVITWTEAASVLDAIEHSQEDLVELAAEQRHDFYRKIGGRMLTIAAFRAKVRHELRTGEHV